MTPLQRVELEILERRRLARVRKVKQQVDTPYKNSWADLMARKHWGLV
jgi:hypothetical protein